jgi:hypothetical protein
LADWVKLTYSGWTCWISRQQRGLALAHQRAFGDLRAADAPADGRHHCGVLDVQPGLLHGGLGGGQVGLGQLVGRLGGDPLLLAHRLLGHQGLVALVGRLGLRQAGLGLGLGGQGAVERGAVGGGVQLEQRLAGLDVRAFGEQALLDDAGHTGTYLGAAPGFQPAGQFGAQGHRARLHRHHADLCRRHATAAWSAGRRAGASTAADQRQRRQHHRRCTHHRAPKHSHHETFLVLAGSAHHDGPCWCLSYIQSRMYVEIKAPQWPCHPRLAPQLTPPIHPWS